MAVLTATERPVAPAAPAGEHRPPDLQPPLRPLVLAGDPDDDGSEPHIFRGID